MCMKFSFFSILFFSLFLFINIQSHAELTEEQRLQVLKKIQNTLKGNSLKHTKNSKGTCKDWKQVKIKKRMYGCIPSSFSYDCDDNEVLHTGPSWRFVDFWR